jgi:hypothetical protein
LGESAHNPLVLLGEVSYSRYLELENDEEFKYRLDWVYNELKNYLAERNAPQGNKIAYFSMDMVYTTVLKYFQRAWEYLQEII